MFVPYSPPMLPWKTHKSARIILPISRKMEKLTSRVVVANSHPRSNTVALQSFNSSGRAVHSRTADVASPFPNNLAEVAPMLKICKVWVGFAILSIVPVYLAIVELIGNDGCYI